MTHYPHSTDIAKVAEVFERLASEHPEGVVDMHKVRITRHGDNDHCTACHAGWFALGTHDPEDITWDSIPESDVAHRYSHVRAIARWRDGQDIRFAYTTDYLAVDTLGFHLTMDAMAFFADRPWLWGNPHGGLMFSDADAFGGQVGDLLTLGHLANHWRGVETRTRQIEEEMQRSGRSFDEIERGFHAEESA